MPSALDRNAAGGLRAGRESGNSAFGENSSELDDREQPGEALRGAKSEERGENFSHDGDRTAIFGDHGSEPQ